MTFETWWTISVEQNVTADRAKRFAKEAWITASKESQQEIKTLRGHIEILENAIKSLKPPLSITACDLNFFDPTEGYGY